MEESKNGHTKVSDSAYSNSCNSQSQHSGSSRSRHSNSSGSSGYGGHPSSSQSAIADFSVPKRKEKEFKKKKTPKTEVETVTALSANAPMISTPILETPDTEVTAPLPGSQDTPNLAASNKTETTNSVCTKELRGGVCASEATGIKPVVDIEELEQEESDSPQMIILKSSILSQITSSSNKKQSVSFEEKKTTQNWNKASFADVVVENCHHILKDITSSSGKNLNEYPLQSEFSAMVSMLDGVILYTTPNIKDVLGYPRDMWMGRSFIDLVHPEDRSTFASYITSWVALPHEQNKFCTEPKWSPGFLFCRLRQYRGLKGSSGSFGVTERSLTYKPFQLHLALKDVGKGTQLLVTACLVESAFFKKSEENTSVFATRHDSNTKLTHIDPDAVRFLGFLPHEMLGKSYLDFCHPEDLKEIHKVYEQIMRFENNVTNENPYRLSVQNGGHILVKTEWSGFINPWTHILEGVTGLHKVIKAPMNPDVFAAVNSEDNFPISEEVLQEANGIREKILNLLTKNVEMPDDVKCDITTRCKTITSEVHNAILVAMTKSAIKVDVTQGHNLSEQDSVMLGEISPHHDYYDSKSSTETPPSYNQLNYNDNIQRFFDSKPKMALSLSDESGEGKQDLSRSTDEEGKRPQVVSSSSQGSRKCCSPAHCSGGSGSSDRNSNTPTSTGSYKPPQLTEALLCRHNEDMEKWMVQRHREQRNKTDSKNKKYTHVHEKQSQQESALCHGTKRSGSHSWEGEPYKASKHTHNTVQQAHPGECCNSKLKPQPAENVGIGVTTQTPGINLWPPFSVTLTPICTTQTCSSSSGNYCMLGCCTGSNNRHVRIPHHVPSSPQLGGMIPFYYVPAPHASLAAPPPPLLPMRSAMVPPQEHPGPPINRPEMPFPQQPVPYVAGMIYHPMVSPLVYPLVGPPAEPAVVEQRHVSLSQQHLHGLGLQTYPETDHPVQDHHSYTLKNPTRNHTSDGTVVTPGQTVSTILNGKMQRPASQATSVKAEPGSSVASASLKRGMSESSKKEGYHTSGETEEEGERTDGCQEGESRSSSFYFRRTSTSCSDDISKGTDLTGNQKQDSDNSNTEDMVWEGTENQETREMSKPKLKPPPWLEGVVVNEELILHYKLEKRNLDSVLKHDLSRLQYVSQSQVVNEQLSHLYSELDLMGLGRDLKLEEGEFSWGSTSSSSGGEGDQHENGTKKKQKNLKHMRLGRENDPPAPPCHSAQA